MRNIFFTIFFLLSSPLLASFFDFKTIERANEAYVNGEFQKSAILFGNLKKDDSTVAYNRANALYKAKQYSEALRYYQKAKGVDEAERLHNIGNSYFKMNELDRAIESYEKALKIREDEDTRYNLELAKRKKKEKEKREKQKKNKKKKNGKKENKKNKKKSKKEKKAKKSEEQKREKSSKDKMTPKQKKQEEMRKRELKHMIRELSQKKMPTLMYQTNPKKGERNEQNPW